MISNVAFEVPFENQVSYYWVISEKYKVEERKIKARWVACDFEENTNNHRKDTPTCSKEYLWLVFLTRNNVREASNH